MRSKFSPSHGRSVLEADSLYRNVGRPKAGDNVPFRFVRVNMNAEIPNETLKRPCHENLPLSYHTRRWRIVVAFLVHFDCAVISNVALRRT